MRQKNKMERINVVGTEPSGSMVCHVSTEIVTSSITHEDLLGNLGCGKTILAASTIEELRKPLPKQNASYFFFRAKVSELNTPGQAYRDILASTLKHHCNDGAVLNRFVFVVNDQAS